MLLSVVFSGIGVCRSIMDGHTLGAILPFYIVSFLGLYLYFSVSTIVDIRGKKRVLRVNLVDYLENHLSPRIQVTRQDIERLYGNGGYESIAEMGMRANSRKRADRIEKRTVELMPIGNRLSGTDDSDREGRDNTPVNTSAVTAEELEALLKEFLTG